MADTTNTPTATTARTPNTVKTKFALRVDTAENWAKCTTAPLAGEPCLEKITVAATSTSEKDKVYYNVKYGDGTTLYKDLPYASKYNSSVALVKVLSDTSSYKTFNTGSTITFTDTDGTEYVIKTPDTYATSLAFTSDSTKNTVVAKETLNSTNASGTAISVTGDLPTASTSGFGVTKYSSDFAVDATSHVASLATQANITAAKTVSDNTAGNVTNGSSIKIPKITVSTKGIVTKAEEVEVTLQSNTELAANKIYVTGTESSAANTENQKVAAKVSITPSTGTLDAPIVSATTEVDTNAIKPSASGTTLTISHASLTTSGTGTWTDSHATVNLNGATALTAKQATVTLSGTTKLSAAQNVVELTGTTSLTDKHNTVTFSGTTKLTAAQKDVSFTGVGTMAISQNTTIGKDLIVTGDNTNNNGINGVQAPNFYGDIESKYLRDSDDGTVLILNGGDASTV